MPTRRSLIRTVALAPGAALLPSAGRAQTSTKPLTIGIGGYTFAFLPLLVAKASGLLLKEGLDVTLINTGGGTNTLAAMIGGSVDFTGLVMSDIILAAAKGQKINAFAPLMSQYASDVVISTKAAQKVGLTPDMPLKERLARLKGLTLAISGRGSGTDKIIRYLLSLAGLDPDNDVTLTVVQLDEMYPALRSGRIDGFNTTAPANNRAVRDGFAVWAARPSQGEVPGLEHFLYTVLAGRPDTLAKQPALAESLVRGLTKGAELIHQDPKTAGQFLHDAYFQETDLRLIQAAVSDQRTTVAVPPTLSEQQFQQNIAFELRFNPPVKNVSYSSVINPAWLHA